MTTKEKDLFEIDVNTFLQTSKSTVKQALFILNKPNVYEQDLMMLEEELHYLDAAKSLFLLRISKIKRTLT